MIRIFLYIILMICITSCKKNVVQKPIENQKDSFIVESSIREKNRQKAEYDSLKKWIDAHSEYDFEMNQYGYWIHTEIAQNSPSEYPEDLDFVQYLKQYKDLDGNIIYDFETLGIQNKILGKTEEIRGIETALRSLNEGDKVQLLLPSFMAYGLYGDDNKIGAHNPIVVELEVLQVKKSPK